MRARLIQREQGTRVILWEGEAVVELVTERGATVIRQVTPVEPLELTGTPLEIKWLAWELVR